MHSKWSVWVLASLALVSCATQRAAMAPGDVREMCFEAAAGNTIVYRFEGSGPLAFNLHYHDDETIYFPVPEHETAAEKGQFLATEDRTYCLMWTNHTQERITVEPAVEGANAVQFH